MSALAFSPAVASSEQMTLVNCFAASAGVTSVGRMPFAIPKAEAYFWSSVWQAGEQESLDAHARGERIVFDSDDPTDAVRWLLSE